MLRILKSHPGISATVFAGLMWPHLNPKGPIIPPLLAAEYLRIMKKKGLVNIRYSGNVFKERTRCIYYLSELGYEICDYYQLNPQLSLPH